MSVVGFDLGYQTCYVAVARHGGVEVVANEYSDRCTPSVVGFGAIRTIGHSAKNQWVRNPENTVYGVKSLLGRKFSDPYVQEEIKHLPFKVVELPGDVIGIKVTHRGESETFRPEQIAAIQLTYLKKVAETSLGKAVNDCVISVPSYFTDAQRRALLDATTISGLNCLRLMNESTAVALNYGIYKQDFPSDAEKPRNVVFVDCGHHAMQVTICAFQKGKLKVLAKTFDCSLGGRNFDYRLKDHFVAEIKKKYKVDSSNPRQWLRLLLECDKMKQLMSASTIPVSLNLECYAEDKDVAGRMSREELEKICEDVLARMKRPLEEAMTQSGLQLADIHSVEIVGGASRSPAIKEVIRKFFNMELCTTLNQDEAVARGCALQCAILSPTFKVRDFAILDTQPYSILIKWLAAEKGEQGEMVVFTAGDVISQTLKALTFYRKESFSLEAWYQHPERIPYTPPLIGKFNIKNIVPTSKGEASKVKVKLRLNIHGIFNVRSASMIETISAEEKMEVEPAVPTPIADATAAPTPAATTAEPAATTAEPAATTAEPAATDVEMEESGNGAEEKQEGKAKMEEDEMSTEAKEPSKEAPPGAAEPGKDGGTAETKESSDTKLPEAKKAKKPTTKHIELSVDEITSSLPQHLVREATEKEVNMIHQDQVEVEKLNAKNTLEEFIYEMKNKSDTTLSDFMSEEERQKLTSQLEATEQWLYDEGEDQPKKVYVERLNDLKKLTDPVVERERELQERPKAFEEFGSAIVHFNKILEKFHKEGVEDYKHIEADEMKKVQEAVLAAQTWLNTQMQAVSKQPKYATPAVKAWEIRSEKKKLETTSNPIVTKPKPKVEPPKDVPKEGPKDAPPPPPSQEAPAAEQPKANAEQQPAEKEDMDVD